MEDEVDKEWHDLINALSIARLKKNQAQDEEDQILTKMTIYLENIQIHEEVKRRMVDGKHG
jgi:hypothetical protein